MILPFLVDCEMQQTESVRSDGVPSFQQAFVIPCQGPRDAVVLTVCAGSTDSSTQMIGEAFSQLIHSGAGLDEEPVARQNAPVVFAPQLFAHVCLQ